MWTPAGGHLSGPLWRGGGKGRSVRALWADSRDPCASQEQWERAQNFKSVTVCGRCRVRVLRVELVPARADVGCGERQPPVPQLPTPISPPGLCPAVLPGAATLSVKVGGSPYFWSCLWSGEMGRCGGLASVEGEAPAFPSLPPSFLQRCIFVGVFFCSLILCHLMLTAQVKFYAS